MACNKKYDLVFKVRWERAKDEAVKRGFSEDDKKVVLNIYKELFFEDA